MKKILTVKSYILKINFIKTPQIVSEILLFIDLFLI